MSPVLEHMTFDDLSELYRVEMSGSSVSEVRRDLFRAMADLMTRLRSEYERLYGIDPDSVMCEGAEHKKKSAERLCREIIRIRSDKILKMAFLGALGSNGSIDALTEEEKVYYYKIVEASKAHLAEVDRLRGKRVTVATHIDEIPARDMPKEAPAPETRIPDAGKPPEEEEFVPPDEEKFVPPEDLEPQIDRKDQFVPPDGEEPVPPEDSGPGKTAPEEKPAAKAEPPAEKKPSEYDVPQDADFQESFDDIPDPLDMDPEDAVPLPEDGAPEDAGDMTGSVLIVVLEDLPEFSGPDRDYSLKRQDLVTLPKALADVLVEAGKAAPVSPSP
jgi:DNA replication initiation complex subunit (GINS family)